MNEENTMQPPPQKNEDLPQEARTFGMLCHLTAFAGFIVPLGNIIGPLVMWLIKKDQYPFVDDQGKESLNFQISVLIYAFISGILVFVVIGIFLLIALGIFVIVMVIIATIRANEGQRYRYPLTIRIIT
jgi:uncharacterized Tic20 family protein